MADQTFTERNWRGAYYAYMRAFHRLTQGTALARVYASRVAGSGDCCNRPADHVTHRPSHDGVACQLMERHEHHEYTHT